MIYEFPITFPGVDGVRIVQKGGKYAIETQWKGFDKVDWYQVGPDFVNVEAAINQAPNLCEF